MSLLSQWIRECDPLLLYFLQCEHILLQHWDSHAVTFPAVGSAKHRKALHLLAVHYKLKVIISTAAPAVWYVNPQIEDHSCVHFLHSVWCEDCPEIHHVCWDSDKCERELPVIRLQKKWKDFRFLLGRRKDKVPPSTAELHSIALPKKMQLPKFLVSE